MGLGPTCVRDPSQRRQKTYALNRERQFLSVRLEVRQQVEDAGVVHAVDVPPEWYDRPRVVLADRRYRAVDEVCGSHGPQPVTMHGAPEHFWR